jgi:hypothetical protein
LQLKDTVTINPQKGNAETMPNLIGAIFQYVRDSATGFVRSKTAAGKARAFGLGGNFFQNTRYGRFRVAVVFTKTDYNRARNS